MKIAVWHNLPNGGGMRALHDQVRGLVARGHHVEIWCPPTADRSFLPFNGLVEEHILPLDGNPAPRRGPVNRRLQPYHEMVGKLGAMDRHCRTCAEAINRGGFDVMLAHPCQFFRATPIGRYVEVPDALYLQEPFRWLYEAWPRLPWLALPSSKGRSSVADWKGFIRDLVEVQAFRVQAREELASVTDFDQILVNSMFSRESVLRAFGLDSKVCYLGVDTEAFQPVDVPKENYVVGLGNIYDNKGLHVAVAGLGAIEESVRPALVWIGNFAHPPYLHQIQEQARSLGVRFQHKVNVGHEELVDTMARASVMVYTSRLEPFGYAPLEANACGTAVVGVAEGGIRETVRDGVNGTLVGDSDPAELGRAILGYCSDPDKARAVGQAARRNVEENWSLAASIDRLEHKLIGLRDVTSQVPIASQAR